MENLNDRGHQSHPRKKSLSTILKEALKDASRDDLCTIEGIDSATGKPFTMDYEDLLNGKDTIRKAVERCNPPE